MSEKLIVFCMAAIVSLGAGSAMADDSINGRLGVSGRIGFIVPADNEAVSTGVLIGRGHTDAGFVGGGGFIYGVTDHIAAEFDITHSSFGTDSLADFDTTDISMGVQYRFLNIPVRHLVPYVGGGLDILINGANNGLNVDTVVGVNAKAGVDYFVMRNFALTSELKGVLAPNADINRPGSGKIGDFDPDSFTMTFGVRYFFN